MQKRARSILDELDTLLVHKDRENLVESRATHVISGAINLINYIRENYDAEQAAELERRLSIQSAHRNQKNLNVVYGE